MKRFLLCLALVGCSNSSGPDDQLGRSVRVYSASSKALLFDNCTVTADEPALLEVQCADAGR